MVYIGNSTMTKIDNDENVTMEVMVKIGTVLECNMDDIIEIISHEQ
jgi:DNA-binding Xre family transcriptional regulator